MPQPTEEEKARRRRLHVEEILARPGVRSSTGILNPKAVSGKELRLILEYESQQPQKLTRFQEMEPRSPLGAMARYVERGERTLGLLGGTVVGGALNEFLDPYDRTPIGRWLPDWDQVPEAFSAFEQQRRLGDWDAAIGAYQEELGGGPGFWGTAELATSAFVPTGGPALAGRKLITSAPKLAETLAKIAPRVVRPAVETGLETGLTRVGQVARAPWEIEEAAGRLAAEGIGKVVGPLVGRFRRGQPPTAAAPTEDIPSMVTEPQRQPLPEEEDIMGNMVPVWGGSPAGMTNRERLDAVFANTLTAIRDAEYLKGQSPRVADMTRRMWADLEAAKFAADPKLAAYEARLTIPVKIGKKALTSRLQMEVNLNRLDQGVADVARKWLNMLPDEYLNDLGSSYLKRLPSKDPTSKLAGTYTYGYTAPGVRTPAIITISREMANKPRSGDRTIIHEVAHHLEEFVSSQDSRKLIQQYERDKWNSRPLRAEVEILREIKKSRHLTAAEATKIDSVYRYDNFPEWFAEVLTDKALRDIYMELPRYRNIIQKVLDKIRIMAEATREFIAKVIGRSDDAERVYKKLISGDYSVAERRSLRLVRPEDEFLGSYPLSRIMGEDPTPASSRNILPDIDSVIKGEVRLFHGSQNVFEAFELGQARGDSLYGPGVYLTADPTIASGYARTRPGVEAAPNVRPVTVQLNKVLDIDAPADKELLEGLQQGWADYLDDLPYYLEDRVDDASFDLLAGRVQNPTNKQVYRMMRQFMDGEGYGKVEANDLLSHEGYDGITYIGGGITGSPPHRVTVVLGDQFASVDQAIKPAMAPLYGDVPVEPPPTRIADAPTPQAGAADVGRRGLRSSNDVPADNVYNWRNELWSTVKEGQGFTDEPALYRAMSRQEWEALQSTGQLMPGREGAIFVTNDIDRLTAGDKAAYGGKEGRGVIVQLNDKPTTTLPSRTVTGFEEQAVESISIDDVQRVWDGGTGDIIIRKPPTPQAATDVPGGAVDALATRNAILVRIRGQYPVDSPKSADIVGDMYNDVYDITRSVRDDANATTPNGWAVMDDAARRREVGEGIADINPRDELQIHYGVDPDKADVNDILDDIVDEILANPEFREPPTPVTPAARAVEQGGAEGLQRQLVVNMGAPPPADIPPMAGAPTTPPEGVRGNYLADLPTMNQIVPEVITSVQQGRIEGVVGWLAAKSGINPSVLETDPIGKGVVAFNRLLVSAREMTNVALSAALDKHVRRGLGTLGRALPIDPETGFLRGTNHPWQDVFSDPERYAAQLTPETRAYIDDFNALIAEMNQRLQDRGLAQLPTRDVDGKFYVPRQVTEVGGVTLKKHSNPNLRRVYDEALEGYDKGIRYDVDPRATVEIYLNAGWRDIVQQDLQIYMLENATAITPKQLINPALVSNVEESARALREAHSLLAAAQRTRLRLQTGGKFLGEERKAQKLIRAAKRPEVLANDKAIKTAKSTVTRLRKRYKNLRTIYQSEMKAAKAPGTTGTKPAPANLFGLVGDHISVKMWRNKFYPEEQAEALIKGVDSLREGKAVTPIAKLINTMRTGAAVGDFAMPFIHGQVMLFRNPVGWAKMTARHYESFFDPTVQSRVINDNLEDFQWMAANGVPIGDPEFFAGAMTGQGLGLENLPWAGKIGPHIPKGPAARRVLRAFGRQSFGRFQSSYNVGLGMARLEMLKALRPTWKGTDAELAQYLRNLTGGLDSRALGVGPTQRNIESFFLAFSPRLLRSTVALVGDAMRPWTPQGREALRSLGSWVAGIHMTYILTGVALGKTWEEIQRGMNPLEGGKYLSHEINGDWIGAGGQVRAILQATAHITATVGGGDTSGLSEGGIMANPLLRAYYYRAAPGTSLGVAAGEFVFQRDLSPFDEIDTGIDLFNHIVTSTAPFALQGKMEGENWGAMAFALAGARTGITRPEAAIYALTLNVGGVESNYFDLDKHPEVIEYAKNRLPADLHDLADEYIEADYDRQKEMRRVENGRKVAAAFEKASRGPTKNRPAGAPLYRLKGEFVRAAPIQWKQEMAAQRKNFPGMEGMSEFLLLREEAGKRIPDIDYSQWYRRGDVPAWESTSQWLQELVGTR